MDRNAVLGGALLIAGTSMGGGMLALPVATSVAGFLPTLLIYLLSALIMGSTALLVAEVSCAVEGKNLSSMAEETLGAWSKPIVWLLYLFLFYCLMIAYFSGLGAVVGSLYPDVVSPSAGPLVVAVVTLALLLARVLFVETINGLFMIGMGIAFAFFFFLGFPSIDHSPLIQANWQQIGRVFPITFVAFAFQGTMPTIVRSLKEEREAIQKATCLGVALPFLGYVLWHLLVAGNVTPERLQLARQLDQSAIVPLGEELTHTWVGSAGRSFGFFALATSLIGVSLGMRDFFADGLGVKRNGLGRLLVAILTVLPPLAITYAVPNLFLTALEYAGGIGCALLLGLFPVLMAWQVRRDASVKRFLLPGYWDKGILILLAGLILFEVACQMKII